MPSKSIQKLPDIVALENTPFEELVTAFEERDTAFEERDTAFEERDTAFEERATAFEKLYTPSKRKNPEHYRDPGGRSGSRSKSRWVDPAEHQPRKRRRESSRSPRASSAEDCNSDNTEDYNTEDYNTEDYNTEDYNTEDYNTDDYYNSKDYSPQGRSQPNQTRYRRALPLFASGVPPLDYEDDVLDQIVPSGAVPARRAPPSDGDPTPATYDRNESYDSERDTERETFPSALRFFINFIFTVDRQGDPREVVPFERNRRWKRILLQMVSSPVRNALWEAIRQRFQEVQPFTSAILAQMVAYGMRAALQQRSWNDLWRLIAVSVFLMPRGTQEERRANPKRPRHVSEMLPRVPDLHDVRHWANILDHVNPRDIRPEDRYVFVDQSNESDFETAARSCGQRNLGSFRDGASTK